MLPLHPIFSFDVDARFILMTLDDATLTPST